MYTYTFTVKDGIFTEVSGEQCELISPTQAKLYDWECTISQKGLTCICTQPCGLNSKITLKYIIRPNGLSRLIMIVTGNNTVVRNKKWLSKPGKFNFSGIVTLSGGEISHRFAKFKANNES